MNESMSFIHTINHDKVIIMIKYVAKVNSSDREAEMNLNSIDWCAWFREKSLL